MSFESQDLPPTNGTNPLKTQVIQSEIIDSSSEDVPTQANQSCNL